MPAMLHTTTLCRPHRPTGASPRQPSKWRPNNCCHRQISLSLYHGQPIDRAPGKFLSSSGLWSLATAENIYCTSKLHCELNSRVCFASGHAIITFLKTHP